MRTRLWVGKKEFEHEILVSSAPTIVLFAAEWCGYCRRFLNLVNEYRNDSEVAVVNVDSEDGSLWDDWNIDLVPTLAVFSGGKEIFRRNGKSFVGLGQRDLEDSINAATIKSP
jgi:thioredoxin-like negative regulator of GroEL